MASSTPVVPSHEFSGVVARVGGDVRSLTPGTQGYGLIDFNHDGAPAEFVSLPQEAVVRRPECLSHVESAALPLAALTAWQALSDRAHLQPDERVFIQGGAGGVGRGGRLVTLAQPLDQSMTESHGIQGIYFVVASDPDELRRIADLADEGKLRPVIAQTFPLAEAAVAYGPPPTPRRPGKTVLVVQSYG